MSAVPPILCEWSGDSFIPVRHHAKVCDKHFVIGQRYALVEHQERSSASHAQYFAALHEAWMNLPEDQAERFPTVERLRKYALIKTGYCESRDLVARSAAEAERIRLFVQLFDEYAIVTAKGAVITVWTAKSQSYRAMGKTDFEASKQAVLDYVAALIQVAPGELAANVGRAA